MPLTGEITVKTPAFQSAAAWAAKWVSSKPIVPLHGGLMLDAAGGKLTIGALSENVTARAVVEYEGDGAGRTVISGRLLAGLASTFAPGKPVTLTGDGAFVELSAGRFRASMPVLADAADYPALPGTLPAVGTVAGDALAAAVGRCGVAAGEDISKGAVMGVMYLGFTADTIRVMATDRYRAAAVRIPWTAGDLAEHVEFAAPLGTVMVEAAASFAGPDDVVIGCDGMTLSLTSPTRSMTVRLIDLFGNGGQGYPVELFEGHLRYPYPLTAVLDPSELIQPLKRADMMREKKGPVKVTFTDGLLTLAAASTEIKQTGDDEVDVDYAGPETVVSFNPQYLGDALSSVPGGKVTMQFGEPRRPIVLSTPDDPTWRHVLMPVQPLR